MGLSIKNADLERRVRQLAARRGLGITSAIELAVANELAKDAVPPTPTRDDKIKLIRDIQDRVAARGGLPSMKDMDDWLYDEYGAPH